MADFRGFKFVSRLFLIHKEVESEYQTKYDTFDTHSKAE